MSTFVNGVYAATLEDLWSLDILAARSKSAWQNKHLIEMALIPLRMTREEKAKFWSAVDGVNYRLDKIATVRRKCGRSGWWSAS